MGRRGRKSDTSRTGNTPHIGSKARIFEGVKLLLERGAHINAKLPNGTTALKAAALATQSAYGDEIDNLALCKLFLKHGAHCQGAEEPMLRHTVERNDLIFFDRLQKLGALPHPMVWPKGTYNLTLPMAKKLIAAGADPNFDTVLSYSASPLQISISKKDFLLTLFLLDHGAKLEQGSLASAIPDRLLSPEEQKRQAEVFRQIQEEDHDPFSHYGEDESPQPAYDPTEDLRWLKLFLERGANPNLAFGYRKWDMPLHIAARNNRVGAIKLLLAAGANLEAKNGQGQTPLVTAVRSLSDQAVPALLDAGADIEARDDKSNTPLLLAAA